jgi:hypothetical protein
MQELISRSARGAANRISKQIDELRYRIWRLTQKNPTLREPIFFIGCPRSGTSVAVRLFASHPWVANWSEAGQVWDPARYYDPEADHHWRASDVTPEAAARLHARFEHYRRSRDKKRFVNKHPRSSVRVEYIAQVFPDAFFVHVIRDGRAVVNSIANKIREEPERQTVPFGNFCKPPNWRQLLREDLIEQSAWQWREIVGHILDKKDLLGERFHQFKYEDMCANPREVLASVAAFAGLPTSEGLLDQIPASLENMNYKFKEDLTSRQIAVISEIQQDLLVELGYCPEI